MADGDKKCLQCGHPMMEGPLKLHDGEDGPYRIADWWCANCHSRIWAKEQPEEEAE